MEQVVEVAGFSKLKLRPIRLDDEGKMVEFHRGISPKSIVLRYSDISVSIGAPPTSDSFGFAPIRPRFTP